MKHILEADGVQLAFDGRKILSDIYLRCETDSITGLLGRNGEGKSCLMNAVYGTQPCEKSIRFDHVSIPASFSQPALIRFLPQFNFIPGSLSVRRAFKDFDVSISDFAGHFNEFTDKTTHSMRNLSGGERRLVEIYLILKCRSRFALLDEPFTHLNPLQIEKVKALMSETKSVKGILLTDHMHQHVTDIADNVYLLSKGRLRPVNHPDDLQVLGYMPGRQK